MPPRLAVFASALVLAACHQGQPPPPAEPPAATPAPTLAAAHPETRKFRDWLAVCDNGGACVAFGPSLRGETGWLRISLEAGPDALPVIMAGFWGDSPAEAQPPAEAARRFAFHVDARRFPADSVQTSADGGGRLTEIRTAPMPVIDALAAGRRLTLTDGVDRVQISLSGAAAALLWIDERQGRLGTTTALIRRGPRPASTVPAAPPLPSVKAAAAVDQTGLPAPVPPRDFEARADVQACRADTRFTPGLQGDVSIDRLSPDRELWGVPCFAGAYNVGFRYFLTGPGGADPKALRLPTSRQPTEEVVNSGYDPATRTLSAFDKGRGIGDCGVASQWVWTGRDFVLKQETEMRECWGVPADLWPSTWRTAP